MLLSHHPLLHVSTNLFKNKTQKYEVWVWDNAEYQDYFYVLQHSLIWQKGTKVSNESAASIFNVPLKPQSRYIFQKLFYSDFIVLSPLHGHGKHHPPWRQQAVHAALCTLSLAHVGMSCFVQNMVEDLQHNWVVQLCLMMAQGLGPLPYPFVCLHLLGYSNMQHSSNGDQIQCIIKIQEWCSHSSLPSRLFSMICPEGRTFCLLHTGDGNDTSFGKLCTSLQRPSLILFFISRSNNSGFWKLPSIY